MNIMEDFFEIISCVERKSGYNIKIYTIYVVQLI